MDGRGRSLDPLTRRASSFALASLLLFGASPTAAQAPEALVLLPRCEPHFGGERFRRLLALELSLANVDSIEVREIDDGEPTPPGGAQLLVQIEASCEVGGRAIISASAGPGAPSVHQVLDLTEVDPSTRGRAIAVATAEQVRLQHLLSERAAPAARPAGAAAPTARSVITPRAAEGVSPAALAVASESGVRPPSREPRLSAAPPVGSLWFSFESRGFPELGTWPMGLRLGAVFLLAPLHIGLDAGAGFASAGHPRGRVELWTLTAGVAIGARWQATREVGVTPNLRADIGYVVFSGFPIAGDPHRGQGASVVTVISVRVDAVLAERFELVVDADVGPTLVSNIALADEDEIAGVGGFALALRLGFAFAL